MTIIEQSYVSPRLYPRLSILAVGLFVVATNAFVIAGLLPSIASSLSTKTSGVGYSITYYSIVVAVVAPAISMLVPRLSRTALMALGLVLVAVGTVTAAAAGDLAVFTIGRVIGALGGAALVPAATAAAAALAPPERRGRAIAFVAVGFTAAAAFGAPLGTLVASIGGWRDPLFALAGIALLTAVAIAVFVRDIPLGDRVSARRRFGILKDPRVLLSLATTLFAIMGFNVVYIFSSAVAARATGGSGSTLALLLLVFGVAGIAGNLTAGPLTDRFGGRAVAGAFLGTQAVVLLLMPVVATSLIGTAVVFAIWGMTANGALLPVQHRLVAVDPATSGVALSWYSTAMYTGIALAPPLGAFALSLGNAEFIPLFGAVVVVIALVAFQFGWGRRVRPARATTPVLEYTE